MDEIEIAKGVLDLGFTGFLIILVLIGMRQYHVLQERFLKHLEDYHEPHDDEK